MTGPATSSVASNGGVDLTLRHLDVADGPTRRDAARRDPVRRGSGRGPTVLLVHANGFHGAVWSPLAALLPVGRAVAPDLRAHGASTRPSDGDLGWERFADDVLAVVDALGMPPSPTGSSVGGAGGAGGAGAGGAGAGRSDAGGPVVGVGHSLGGAALLLAEQRRPGTFASLHLYEPVVFPPSLDGAETAEIMAAQARRRRDRFASSEEAYDNYRAKPPMDAFHPEVLRAYVEHGLEPDPEGGSGLRLRCRPDDEAEAYRRGAEPGPFARLGEVSCPVVVARGDLGPAGPGHVAATIAEALPQGRLEVHPGLGHFGPLERPDRLAEAVAEVVTPHA